MYLYHVMSNFLIIRRPIYSLLVCIHSQAYLVTSAVPAPTIYKELTYPWSSPHNSGQLIRLQYSVANGPTIWWKHVIDVPRAINGAVFLQLFEVLIQELVRVGGRSSAIFLIAFIHNIQTHTRRRHSGRWESGTLK